MLWCGYLGSVFGAWVLIGVTLNLATVVVDNYATQDLVVELDGKPWLTCPKGTTVQVYLRGGTYELVIRAASGSEELDRFQIDVEGRVTYVLNLLRAQTYSHGNLHYAEAQPLFGNPIKERAITDSWFKADEDYVFQEPPTMIKVRRDSDKSVRDRSYLRRGAPQTERQD
jgi:hypothetical protein